MKCYCIETEEEFIFYIENTNVEYEKRILDAWYQKIGNGKYAKKYPNTICDKVRLKDNFSRLGESMFSEIGDWEKALNTFVEKCNDENIVWYITGSVSEAVIGVKVLPHDIDIVCHVKDFFRLKNIFLDYLIEPFVDNQGIWVVRYFGRLCIEGVMLDIVADESRNEENHVYTPVYWHGHTIKVEPLHERYKIEIQRKRENRIKAIEEYLGDKNKI